MPDDSPTPAAVPQEGYILCISKGPAQRRAFHETSRTTAPRVELLDAPDTYAARAWLTAGRHHDATTLPLLVFAEYNPDEQWSLAVLLSQLRKGAAPERDGLPGVPVVLAAQGPAYSLPISVSDYPDLTVVPPDFHTVDRLADKVGNLVAAAGRSVGKSVHAD